MNNGFWDRGRLMGLFRRIFRPWVQSVSEEQLAVIEVALIDMSDEVREIYGEILPSLERTQSNGSINQQEILDRIIDLKTAFGHIQYHLTHGAPALDELIIAFGKPEKPSLPSS